MNLNPHRVRVKICGLSQPADVDVAADAGADAIGFNCYPQSPRYVTPDALAALVPRVPAFVTPVLLFVNAGEAQVRQALAVAPHALLQFHGDETPAYCASFGQPYLRAVRMEAGVALLDCARLYGTALALLVDAPAPGYGGGGAVFDWSRLPAPGERDKPLVLAGGLDETNVADAIRRVRPWAVDVSSGVERARGIKDPDRIRRFIAAVRAAEQSLN